MAAELRRTHPEIGVVVLSQYAEPSYGLALLDGGSDRRAYLLKERVQHGGQLVTAIETVADGGSVMDAKVVESADQRALARRGSPLGELTPRELEILAFVARGHSNQAIADELVLTKRAVEKHINAIFLKLDLTEALDVSRRVKAALIYLAETDGLGVMRTPPGDAGVPVCGAGAPRGRVGRDGVLRSRGSPSVRGCAPLRLVAAWLASALGLLLAAGDRAGRRDARLRAAPSLVAALVAVLNAVLPPVIAALRLPFTVAIGFLLVLALDAAMLLIAADIAPEQLQVDGFWAALAVAIVAAAISMAIGVLVGIDDDDGYTLRVARRVARRAGQPIATDGPGILFLEIDGLALPVLRRAIRDGTTPNMARWLAEGTHRLVEWETDLSSQTGASQAGILLGDNDDIPAFRWVDKATGPLVTCSNPDDCAAIERDRVEHARACSPTAGRAAGTCSPAGPTRRSSPSAGCPTRSRRTPATARSWPTARTSRARWCSFLWELYLELVAAARQRRRDVRPRGHRGGSYPLLRAGMCVFVRDLIVFSVLQDMFRGVPAVYATFASYDEVAHHSGLERPDTLEALRKLDQRFGMIERARRYAPRPYEIVVLSDHGQTQGATFLQRNGYGLDELVRALALAGPRRGRRRRRRERQRRQPGARRGDRPRRTPATASEHGRARRHRARLGQPRPRLPDGEPAAAHARGDRRAAPGADPGALRAPARRLRARALRRGRADRDRRAAARAGSPTARSTGEDPLAGFSPNAAPPPAPHRRLPARRRHRGQQLLRPGDRGGLRVRGADLVPRRAGRPADRAVHPASGAAGRPGEPLVGAEAVHRLLRAWRAELNGTPVLVQETGPASPRRSDGPAALEWRLVRPVRGRVPAVEERYGAGRRGPHDRGRQRQPAGAARAFALGSGRPPVWEFVVGGPIDTPAEWAGGLDQGRFSGEAGMLCADGGIVAVQWGASTEVATGSRFVLFVALSTSRWGAALPKRSSRAPTGRCTDRQREIVQLVALGLSGPEIAAELQIAHETVRTHVRTAKERLGARSRAHLVAKALGEGHV